MIAATDLKKGMAIELDGRLYAILDFQHIKMGRGSAQVRLKMKDIRAGHITERTFQAGEKFSQVQLELSNAQYLYQDGDFYHFMDQETYEQPAVKADVLGDSAQYLKPEMEVKLTFYQGEPIDVELPLTIDLLVTRAEPAVRGNTATGVTKKVETETGLEVQVPAFVEESDVIRVDTRSGSYVTRA